MSENKPPAEKTGYLWALAFRRRPPDPLSILLMKEAERTPTKYIRPDGSPNKTAILRDLITAGLHAVYTERGDEEALKTLETTQTGATVNQPITPAPTQPQTPVTPPQSQVPAAKKKTIKASGYIDETGQFRLKQER